MIVRTTPELTAALSAVSSVRLLALDTEFVWRRTYRPQLGIVQFGTGGDDSWALDVLQGLDPTPLAELIADPSVVKILHDARQDLQHLRHYCGVLPHNVFDTQLAASFAGFPHGIGLQKLLFEAIGVGLAKTETCTDWTARPLSEAQVRYALDDVRYLPELRAELLRRAESFGTRAWLEEDLAAYDDLAVYADGEPEMAWRKIRLQGWRFSGVDFAVLRALAACREETARAWNLPRKWLGDDGDLVFLVRTRDVGRLRHRLDRNRAELMRARYAEAIASALALPEEEWPENPRRYYIREVLDAADAAMDWLAEKAEELHVAPVTIAGRDTVTAFVDDVNDETNPLAHGWRWEAVGEEMAERFGVD